MTQLEMDAEVFRRVVLAKIQLRRKEKRVTEAVMATALGMSHSNYCRIENGDTIITVEQLFKVARVLGCKVDDLL